jgi:hypothetical protein
MTPPRLHFFWLSLYAVLDLSWIWHDQIAYNFWAFKNENVLTGKGCAPEQYRIAAPLAADWIAKHLHLHSFVAGSIVIDLLGSLLLSFFLYQLADRHLQQAPPTVQNLAKLFVGLWMLFYLHWSNGYARVETIPSCVYVVLSLLLIPLLGSGSRRVKTSACVGFLSLSLLQGWVRADVAVVFAVGVCVAALFPSREPMSTGRAGTFVIAACAAVLSGGSLLYLMRVLYPNAHYCVSPWSLSSNVRHSYFYIPFATLILPLGWGVLQSCRRFHALDLSQRSILIGFCLYLVIWSCMGSWGEARIIAPFAMGMLPAVGSAMAHFLTDYASSGEEEP